jgi:uncharacterized membrane protein YphA (DoxX/SURF4 family)
MLNKAKMLNMDDSIAQARIHAGGMELPAWKTVLSVASAVLIAVLFLVAGTWKITDPFGAAERMIQALVPGSVALAAAVSLGIAETVSGVFLLVPRFRRWGAWIAGLLLLAFMVYIGVNYTALRGEECNCFPMIKRAVGPGFFIGDAVMLLLALFAGLWARSSEGVRGAGVVLAVVCVFAFASLGIAYARQTGAPAPASIQVEGHPYSLTSGKHFIYFFDPECSHCYQAAKEMATHQWTGATVIAVPTINPQFAPGFLQDTGLKARLTPDHDKLKEAFPFGDAPFAVAVENGRQVASFRSFEEGEPANTLRKIGFIE